LNDAENIFNAINSRAQKLKASEGVKRPAANDREATAALPNEVSPEKRPSSEVVDAEVAGKRRRFDIGSILITNILNVMKISDGMRPVMLVLGFGPKTNIFGLGLDVTGLVNTRTRPHVHLVS
jgi:hypothetical protein